MTRKRGAPPGNANAYKHGFYTPRFKAEQLKALEKLTPDNLQAEIDRLRVYLDRFTRISSQFPGSYEKALADLNAVTTATELLARLVRLSMAIQNLSIPLQDQDDWLTALLSGAEPPSGSLE